MDKYYEEICKVLKKFDRCKSENGMAESITIMYNILADIKNEVEVSRER